MLQLFILLLFMIMMLVQRKVKRIWFGSKRLKVRFLLLIVSELRLSINLYGAYALSNNSCCSGLMLSINSTMFHHLSTKSSVIMGYLACFRVKDLRMTTYCEFHPQGTLPTSLDYLIFRGLFSLRALLYSDHRSRQTGVIITQTDLGGLSHALFDL